MSIDYPSRVKRSPNAQLHHGAIVLMLYNFEALITGFDLNGLPMQRRSAAGAVEIKSPVQDGLESDRRHGL